MIRSRWHLPLLLGLLAVAAPLAANDTQQVLFNFVKPMAVVGITLEDADLPSVTAEATPEGDILRRVTFSPAQRPTLRMSPAQGRWDWSAADYVSLRIQNAMSWDMTLEVAIEGEQGAPGCRHPSSFRQARRRPCWCRCGRFRQRLWACVRGRRCRRWSKASGCCWRHAWRARWTAPGSGR